MTASVDRVGLGYSFQWAVARWDDYKCVITLPDSIDAGLCLRACA